MKEQLDRIEGKLNMLLSQTGILYLDRGVVTMPLDGRSEYYLADCNCNCNQKGKSTNVITCPVHD